MAMVVTATGGVVVPRCPSCFVPASVPCTLDTAFGRLGASCDSHVTADTVM